MNRATPSNYRSSETKKALAPYFGRENVHVKSGKGTARSWTYLHIYLPKPADCYCHELSSGRCVPCLEIMEVSSRVIAKATEHISYGIWYSDDSSEPNIAVLNHFHIGNQNQ